MRSPGNAINRITGLVVCAVFCLLTARAGVLPEDRADVMYHSYDGGGVQVTGPAVLVRKKFGESLSASFDYDADMVTSASIDVRTSGASQYKDKRTQYSGGLEYLRG